MVRKVLSSVLHQQTFDDEGLHTFPCQVESILNDQPITKVSEDPNDLDPITPNHLLIMKKKTILPSGPFDEKDQYARRRWRQVQYLSDLFWKRWIKEYLTLLQERQKWNKEIRHFQPGDIVLIADTAAPCNYWMLGKVLETFPDQKGLVRSARVQTKLSVKTRPISILCIFVEM